MLFGVIFFFAREKIFQIARKKNHDITSSANFSFCEECGGKKKIHDVSEECGGKKNLHMKFFRSNSAKHPQQHDEWGATSTTTTRGEIFISRESDTHDDNDDDDNDVGYQ